MRPGGNVKICGSFLRGEENPVPTCGITRIMPYQTTIQHAAPKWSWALSQCKETQPCREKRRRTRLPGLGSNPWKTASCRQKRVQVPIHSPTRLETT